MFLYFLLRKSTKIVSSDNRSQRSFILLNFFTSSNFVYIFETDGQYKLSVSAVETTNREASLKLNSIFFGIFPWIFPINKKIMKMFVTFGRMPCFSGRPLPHNH